MGSNYSASFACMFNLLVAEAPGEGVEEDGGCRACLYTPKWLFRISPATTVHRAQIHAQTILVALHAHTVHILYTYCTHTVHILYTYCTHTVHILYTYSQAALHCSLYFEVHVSSRAASSKSFYRFYKLLCTSFICATQDESCLSLWVVNLALPVEGHEKVFGVTLSKSFDSRHRDIYYKDPLFVERTVQVKLRQTWSFPSHCLIFLFFFFFFVSLEVSQARGLVLLLSSFENAIFPFFVEEKYYLLWPFPNEILLSVVFLAVVD